jgi:NADH:ubiquinone reductase (non-electrogenic)
MEARAKERVLVLGSGFAAFRFARELGPRYFDVTLVSPRNHFLFTPLLPSTTVGTLEFRSIIEPVRTGIRNVRYYQARARSVDAAARKVTCEAALDGRRFDLAFDSLIIAVGAETNTFGIPGVREHAFFLKEAADARAIRNRILECFEKASEPGLSGPERAGLLRFVVVGGGPTGVEFAAEMHDLVTEDLRRVYSDLVPLVRITLLEATKQILGGFDAVLGAYTMRHFQRQRIEVKTESPVVNVEAGKITLKDGTEIRNGLVVWATGNAPSEFTRGLPFAKDKGGRVRVDESLRVKDQQGLYALGDCAEVEGKGFPATAQVAEQEGKYLAEDFLRRARGRPSQPFRYRHQGMLAYVGSNRALADLSKVKGRGFSTFLFWRSAYLTKLVGIRNRVLVLFDWVKTALFGRDISRF